VPMYTFTPPPPCGNTATITPTATPSMTPIMWGSQPAK
jgi:hypothetical protein